jgi:3'-phosphoadenosine 5'-phosphosulfate sulfotransferase (PAPS reductase)/FAD synthetase
MKSLTKKIVSFSGGKDSTAMLLRLIEEGYQVDGIVFFDTGWEFPEMGRHVLKVQDYIQREIDIVHPEKPFTYWMLERETISRKQRGEVNIGDVYRIGYSWPSPMRRWCTRLKIDNLHRHIKEKYGVSVEQYIGYAADEIKRTGCGNACAGEEKEGMMRLYPLIFDWDMDEAACLQYCYDRGFDWEGLYAHFGRVSCFCCPLQRIGELRKLRYMRPELWAKMLEWDSIMPENKGFRGYATVHDLEKRFAGRFDLDREGR